jgi:serine protease Do
MKTSKSFAAVIVGCLLAVPAFSASPGVVEAGRGSSTPLAVQTPPLPSLSSLVDGVKSAVINVEVTQKMDTQGMVQMFPGDDFFEHFFGRKGPGAREQQPEQQLRQGAGSGFIISPEGLALTNNHVVQDAVSIRVKLDDGRSFDAEVLGRDPLTDVALIKFKGKPTNLPVVALGDSDGLKVGDWLVAIGNPFGLASSVSAGILSAKARNIGAGPYDDFLQTDAAINPGNSGGPLFNLKGEVIGINTAIVGGGTGIGFAVPSNLVKSLLPQLEKSGAVTRGYLGVQVQDLTAELGKALKVPVSKGAVVGEVSPETPAAKAGLKADDVIVAIDGDEVVSSSALTRKVAMKSPGARSIVTLYRGDKKMDIEVKLGTRPDLEKVSERSPRSPQGKVTQEKFGLVLQDLPEGARERMNVTQGVLIAQVQPGSVADRADLRSGMVILEVSSKAVRSARELQRMLAEAKPGEVVLLRVQVGEVKVLRALTVPEGTS